MNGRDDSMLDNEIIQMPKIDLHCHLDGSLPQKCISELLGRVVTLEELQVKDDCQSLPEYLEKFDLPLECLQTAEGLRRAGRDFLMNVQDDNIRYVEVRFAPLLSVNENLSCREVVEAVLAGLEEAKQECGIYYNVIACAMRNHDPKESLNMVKVCREFLNQGVCAIDLAGNEPAFPMENFRELFQEVKRLEMPFTIHAGECGRVQNVVEAVKCGTQRIGHGIALRGNQEAIQLCKNRGIGIEMCPVSNMQTKAVQNIVEYPIREFIDSGMYITINTDNRTVSNTTIKKEIEVVQKNFGVTDDEIRKMMQNAIEVSFASDEVKQILWKCI